MLYWPDLNMGCGKDNSAVRPTLFVPRGTGVPSDWWSGRLGEAPSNFDPLDLTLCEAGIQVSAWGTRWEGGGRWHVERQWREDLQALATARGWSISWEGYDVIVNGSPDWTWEVLEDERTGQTPSSTWTGSAMDNGVVVWVPQRADEMDDVRSSPNPVAVNLGTAKDGVVGRVRNHRTASEMILSLEAETLVVAQDNGAEVWSMTLTSSMLEGGAVEVSMPTGSTKPCSVSRLHCTWWTSKDAKSRASPSNLHGGSGRPGRLWITRTRGSTGTWWRLGQADWWRTSEGKESEPPAGNTAPETGWTCPRRFVTSVT